MAVLMEAGRRVAGGDRLRGLVVLLLYGSTYKCVERTRSESRSGSLLRSGSSAVVAVAQ